MPDLSKRSPRWVDTCDLCQRRYRVEKLSYGYYQGRDGTQYGGGLVCPDCVAALPPLLTNGRGELFPLMLHPY